ncbi:hypothetical protein E1181_25250 [Saccharopolyspora terrae]|uniref:Uncharacterized protein n=1 Tax=Saccharopolyspora terrae TaxID=2530384 RepID=A0A4R4VGX0_9PSEU|nr:hypothetical protein [Saccharopolyspora terrae]TDD01404.1 hypothetical protein E1181_25250 [Saccharopolyspora terrae]
MNTAQVHRKARRRQHSRGRHNTRPTATRPWVGRPLPARPGTSPIRTPLPVTPAAPPPEPEPTRGTTMTARHAEMITATLSITTFLVVGAMWIGYF